MAFANGYTMALTYNLDPLGWMYITIAIMWTIILLMGTTFIIARRHMAFLRIRNIPLAVSAVATLHVYWILCMVAYTFHGFYPCVTEYWIMSIYLPMGIALFQASNTQLLHVASVQRRIADDSSSEKSLVRSRTPIRTGFMRPFMSQNRMRKTMTLIAYAMTVQVCLIVSIDFQLMRCSSFLQWSSSWSQESFITVMDSLTGLKQSGTVPVRKEKPLIYSMQSIVVQPKEYLVDTDGNGEWHIMSKIND